MYSEDIRGSNIGTNKLYVPTTYKIGWSGMLDLCVFGSTNNLPINYMDLDFTCAKYIYIIASFSFI